MIINGDRMLLVKEICMVMRNAESEVAASASGSKCGGVEINFDPQVTPRKELVVELTLSHDKVGGPRGLERIWEYAIIGGLVFSRSDQPDWARSADNPDVKRKFLALCVACLQPP